MSLSPKKNRELIVQMLYAMELGEGEGMVDLLMNELKISKKNVAEAYQLACHIWQNRSIFDERVRACCHSYEFERIGLVERAILRLCLSSLSSEPKAIVIAEAIRLTCKFSTEESAHFVHAIIDTIARESCDPAICSSSQ